MNKSSVVQIIADCIAGVYSEDKYLFDCKICERCLMYRFAYYLQNKFLTYYVDCEFNKMGFHNHKHRDKVMTDEETNSLKRMYTDIIVHKRNSDTSDNFICIEIKRTKRGIEKDILRLKKMTLQSGFRYQNVNYVYAYNYGFLLYLPKDKANNETKVFENGEESFI